MRRLFSLLMGIILAPTLLFSAFSVGDTVTFTTYIVGPFAGYKVVKAMCKAITDHTYIFTQEDFYSIKKVSGAQNTLFALSDDGKLYNFDGTSSWNLDISGVNNFVIKPVTSTDFHLIVGTTEGVMYRKKGGPWTDKTPSFETARKDINIKIFAVSPIGESSSYRLYFVNKKGYFVASGSRFAGPSKGWNSTVGIHIDEDFQNYTEGTPLWGGVVETYSDSILGISSLGLTFGDISSYSSNVSFNLEATDFVAYFSIFTDTLNTPEFRIDFKKKGTSGTYTSFFVEFKNGFVYLNNVQAGPIKTRDLVNFTLTVKDNQATLQYSSIGGVTGSAGPISVVSQSISDRFSGFSFVFGSTSSSKFYLDDVFILPYETKKVVGHASNKDYAFFLTPHLLALYDNSLGEWREILTTTPGNSEFIDLYSVVYADSVLFLVEKTSSGINILKLEDTTGTFSSSPIISTFYSFTGEFLSFSANPSNASQFVVNYIDDTGIPHVMISNDGGATFQDVVSGLPEAGPFDWTGHVNSFFFENDTTFFAGTNQGVFRKVGAGDWEEINSGIIFRFVSDSQVQAFATLVETFPWDAFYSELGPLGINRDNDDRIVIVLSETGYVLTSDYRVPVGSAYDPTVLEDNKVEMIQIDPINTASDVPRDLGDPSVLVDLAYGLAGLHLITWDPKEPTWLKVGAELIGAHILHAGSLDSMNLYDTLVVPKNDILTNYISDNILKERQYAFPFIYYLVEKGGTALLRSWWQDKQNQGLKGLALYGRGDEDSALYYEEVLYDIMTGGFNNIVVDLDYTDLTAFGGWVNGYSTSLSPYTYQAIVLKNPTDAGIITSFKYKGTITNGLFIHPEGEALIVTQPPREGTLTMPNDTITVKRFLFVGYDDGGIGGADQPSFRIAFGIDDTPPSVMAGFFHSNFLQKRVNLFVFSTEKLYRDPSNSSPLVLMIAGSDTTEISVATRASYLDTLPSGESVSNMYTSDIELNFVNGVSKILIKGADLLGNDFQDIEIIFNEWLTQTGTFAYADGSLIIKVPEGAFASTKSVIVSKTDFVPVNDFKNRLSPFYVIGSDDLYSMKPCEVRFKYPGKGILYRYENGSWIEVEGNIDGSGYYVANVDKFGIFAFFDGKVPQNLKFNFSISKTVLRGNEPLMVNLVLPYTVNSELKIINSAGRVLEVVKKGKLSSGSHVFTINALKLKSGNYFILFKSGEYKIKKKFVKIN